MKIIPKTCVDRVYLDMGWAFVRFLKTGLKYATVKLL